MLEVGTRARRPAPWRRDDFGTRIAVASGGKCFTALAVMSLVEQGSLALDTTARSMLGTDLPSSTTP